MLRDSLKIWLFGGFVVALFLMPAVTVAEDLAKSDAAEKDPLLEERAELYAEVREMESQISAIRGREREMHGEYRGAIKGGKNLMDPENVDEDTGKMIVRIQELEAEAKTLRDQLKERLADHPQTVKSRERMDTIHTDIQELRNERTEIQKVKVEKVGRLRMIEQELSERRKAAAEEEARAEEEAQAQEESEEQKENVTNE